MLTMAIGNEVKLERLLEGRVVIWGHKVEVRVEGLLVVELLLTLTVLTCTRHPVDYRRVGLLDIFH